jgi:hypothetical protein
MQPRRPRPCRLGNGRPKRRRRPRGHPNSQRLSSRPPASDRRVPQRRGSARQRLLWRSVDSNGHRRPPRPGRPGPPILPLPAPAGGPIARRRPLPRTRVGPHPAQERLRRAWDGRRRRPAGPDRAADRPSPRPAGRRPRPPGPRRIADGLPRPTAGGRLRRPGHLDPAGRTGLATPTTAPCSPCWRSPSPCWWGSSAQ